MNPRTAHLIRSYVDVAAVERRSIRRSNGVGDVLSDWLTEYYKEDERKSQIEYETASLLMTISFSCKQARRFPYS